MAEALTANKPLTIDHPGTYEVHALQGGETVVAYEDGGKPQSLKKGPKGRGGHILKIKTEGRLHVLATDPAFVEVTRLETPEIDPRQASDSSSAIPEAARKAAGETAAEPSQPPNAGAAVNASDEEPSKPHGAVSNTPLASEFPNIPETPQEENKLAETHAGDVVTTPGKAPEDKPKKATSSGKKHSTKQTNKGNAKKADAQPRKTSSAKKSATKSSKSAAKK